MSMAVAMMMVAMAAGERNHGNVDSDICDYALDVDDDGNDGNDDDNDDDDDEDDGDDDTNNDGDGDDDKWR